MRSRVAGPLVSLVLCLLLALYLGREVSRNHLDVPYWDEWVLAPLIFDAMDGKPSLAAYVAPHNGHRPAVPRAALVALAARTGWDMRAESLLVLAVGFAMAAAGVVLSRRLLPPSHPMPWWAAPAVAAVLLSLNQWGNWLGGWGVGMFFMLGPLLAGLAALARPVGPAAFGTAVLAAVVASFSFANGLLLWFMAIPLLWLNGGARRVAYLLVWILTAALVLGVYLPGLDASPAGGGLTAGTVPYVLQFLGAPLANSFGKVASTAVGAAGLVLVAATTWLQHRTSVRLAVWALVLFAAASGLLVALGRDTASEALVPTRYLSVGNVFWLAILAAWIAEPPAPRAAVAVGVVVAVLATHEGMRASADYEARTRDLASARPVLLSADNDALLGRFFPGPDYLKQLLPQLRDRFLALYACDDPPMAPSWARAVSTLDERTRAGDVVVTSTDWAATCLAQHATGARYRIESVGESREAALATMDTTPGRFLLVGGDVRSRAARDVMSGAYRVWGDPRVYGLGVFYAPDLAAFRRERLTDPELSQLAEMAFAADLVMPIDSRFLDAGWSDVERAGDAFRWATGRTSSVFVPVDAAAPRTLHVEVSPFPGPGISQRITVRVNGQVVTALRLEPGANTFDVDVSGAPWTRGANTLAFDYDQVTVPAEVWPGSEDRRELSASFSALRLSR